MKISAMRMIARSVLKNTFLSLKRYKALSSLQVPSNCVIDTSLRVENPCNLLLGQGVSIGRNVTIKCALNSKIVLRDGVVLRDDVLLAAGNGGSIEIGPRTTLSTGVRICTRNRVTIGPDNSIEAYTSIEPREDDGCGAFTTGAKVGIHAYNMIDLTGDVTVGNETHTGPYCLLYTHNHNYDKSGSIWEQGIRIAPVELGAGIWMGSMVVVMPGVTVESGSIIAASSVVSGKFGQDELLAGIPAKFKRKRC